MTGELNWLLCPNFYMTFKIISLRQMQVGNIDGINLLSKKRCRSLKIFYVMLSLLILNKILVSLMNLNGQISWLTYRCCSIYNNYPLY